MKKNKRFVVIGGANLDLSGRSINAIKPGDSNPGIVDSAAGGVGRNIAENLARLGNDTALVSMVGDDVGKKLVLERCQSAGIDTSGIIVNPNHSTGTYLAITDNKGNLNVAIADMAIYDDFTPEALQDKMAFIEQADELIVEANLPQQTLSWLCDTFADKAIHADAVSTAKAPRLKPVLHQLEVLKVNHLEAARLLNVPESTLTNEQLAQGLYDLSVKQVLLSMAAEGTLWYNGDSYIKQGIFDIEPQSDTGAGDALLAGFITARHLLNNPQQQLAFGLGCAAFALQSEQAVNPTLNCNTICETFLTDIPPGAWI